MSLNDLFRTTVTTKRLSAGLGVTSSYALLGTYQTMIQPMSDRSHIEFGLAIGTGFHMYLPITADIQVADQITDDSGYHYTVTGLRRRNYGLGKHITAYLILEPGK